MHVTRATQIGAAAVATALICSCANRRASNDPPQSAQLARAVAPPSRLVPPEHLPEGARIILRNLMASHARNMSHLVSAIMTLDYPAIREGADSVASDASLSRPLTGDATELNALLPEKFFQYQDDLRGQARALAQAATRHSALEVAASYGALAQTCVQCHAAYRASAP
jgi:hypothetical protein